MDSNGVFWSGKKSEFSLKIIGNAIGGFFQGVLGAGAKVVNRTRRKAQLSPSPIPYSSFNWYTD